MRKVKAEVLCPALVISKVGLLGMNALLGVVTVKICFLAPFSKGICFTRKEFALLQSKFLSKEAICFAFIK